MGVSSAKPRLLVVDDESGMREILAETFGGVFRVSTASNGDMAVELLKEDVFDVVITDLKMPGRDGIGVLRAAMDASADTGVIVMTAYGTIETAVEAMRLGAKDFVAKPFKLEEIERRVDKIVRQQEASRAGKTSSSEVPWTRTMVGGSDYTKQLLKMVGKVGPSRSSVLITGPSGTGKELVARAIHDASPRSDQPYIALNCAALAPGVLESELFGHEKGAFTGAVGQRAGRFERAHMGTLFLDEVGEIDPGTQTKLLRVLQEGEFERVGGTESINVDVRIVAASNQDLRRAISEGRFREDFYYRLNVFSITAAPLRERVDDIPALIDHFLTKFSHETGKMVKEITDEVMDFFLRYAWPGNVRELENVLERAVVLAEGDTITRDEIPAEMFFVKVQAPEAEIAPAPDDASLVERTDHLESQMIEAALERFHWNKTKAAEHLGLKRTTLQYKIKKYGLE